MTTANFGVTLSLHKGSTIKKRRVAELRWLLKVLYRRQRTQYEFTISRMRMELWMLVIIPAAGKGTRLATPYPKELHRISESASLIDLSLRHVHESQGLVNEVAVVVAPGKEMVADYVRSRLPSTKVHSVYFNNLYDEWPGSILSAEKYFTGRNFVLLPDSHLVEQSGSPLAKAYSDHFSDNKKIIFAAKRVDKAEELLKLGALQIDDGRALSFCDKPDQSRSTEFNSFWASFGFSVDAGRPLLEMMARSVKRQYVELTELPFMNSVFEIKSYQDLGTWPSLRKFQAQMEME